MVLDCLRMVAASAVLLHHADLLPHPSPNLSADLFFLLSGFVLAHVYDARLECNLTVYEFFKRRLIRIYPAYLLGTAIGALFMVAFELFGRTSGQGSWATFLPFALLLIPVMSGPFIFPFNPPAWALFLELLVNLAYAMLRPILSNRVLLLLVTFSVFMLVGTTTTYGKLDLGYNASTFLGGVGRVTFSFFTGVLLFRNRRRLPTLNHPVGAIFFAVISALMLIWSPSNPDARMYWQLVIVICIFPVTLAFCASAGPVWARLGAMVSAVVAMSYPVYIFHYPVLMWTLAIANRYSFPSKFAMIFYVPLVMVMAYGGDRFIDRPLRQWLSRRFTQKSNTVNQQGFAGHPLLSRPEMVSGSPSLAP